MHKTARYALVLIFAILAGSFAAVFNFAPAFGQTETTPLPACGADVSGTVVAVDEATNTVTVQTETGLCTVTLTSGTSTQPIVELLGQYFGAMYTNTLAGALTGAQVCATYDEGSSAWTWTSDCETEGAETLQALSVTDNGDGTYTVMVQDPNTETLVPLTIDDQTAFAEIVAGIQNALNTLTVNPGDILSVSDQIAQYHDDGMGFGVLVKLYGLAFMSQQDCAGAADCGVTVEDLVQQFQSGMGMGQLFKLYGKPFAMGVGQVRKAAQDGGTILTSPYSKHQQMANNNGNHGNSEAAKAKVKTKTQVKSNNKGNSNAPSFCTTQGNGKAKGKLKKCP